MSAVVTVSPLPADWTYPGGQDEPPTQQSAYVYLVLDTVTGEFGTLTHHRGEPYDTVPGDHRSWAKLPGPDGRTASFQFLGMPARLSWLTRLRSAETVNAMLTRLAPLAQAIVAGAIPVPGTADRDWTVAAAEAADELAFLAEYPDGVPVVTERGTSVEEQALASRRRYVDAAAVFSARPDLVRPEWASWSSAKLNSEAEMLNRFLVHHNPELYQLLDLPLGRGGAHDVQLLGARAWLYGYRERGADGLAIQDAHAWFSLPGRSRLIGAELSDEQITDLARAQEAVAHYEERLRLVGAVDYIRRARDDERAAIRAELTEAGRRYADAKTVLDRAQKQRAVLLARVLSWDVASDTDTRLAEQAAMSRPGVAKFRAKLADPDGTGEVEE